MGHLVPAVLVALLATGCNSGGNSTANAPSSTAAPATTTTAPAASTSTTASATAADCSNAVLLQAAQQALRESGSTATVASITVTRCRNGYALLSAHPASGGDAPNVFLVGRPTAGGVGSPRCRHRHRLCGITDRLEADRGLQGPRLLRGRLGSDTR
jgi:hypothetical protein